MGRRYYCGYCDRSFIDEAQSRKKHLRSANHENMKRFYFLAYRDLKSLVAEEETRDECRRFLRTGQCPFGNTCNFTHYSKQELQMFKQQAMEEERLKTQVEVPSVEEWIRTRRRPDGDVSWPLEPNPLLPPSLCPVPASALKQVVLTEWG